MRLFMFLCLLGVGLLTPIKKGAADSDDHSRVDNLSALSAEWWQWATSIPTTVNPLLDMTGQNCMVGQHGPVWFLAGFFFGGTGMRDCSVPDDRFLFFPVANNVNINIPDICGQKRSLSVRELRQLSATSTDRITDVSAQLDGDSIRPNRIRSDVFAVAFPENNIFDTPCSPDNIRAGVYSPAVDDGLYVLLGPLHEGVHMLHFHAVDPDPKLGFTQDVTYRLTVVHVNTKKRHDGDRDDDHQ